jgi:hypothetical protein
MDIDAFKQSLAADAPPPVAPGLRALWQEAKGDWDAAHRTVQAEDGADAAWVHAYLHRKEGDPANAAHWYRRADKPVSSASLEAEWTQIASALLSAQR